MLLDIPRLRSPKLPPSFKYWLKRLHVWEKLDFSGKLTDISDELAILVVFNQLRSGNPQAKINFKNKTSALQLTLQNWIGEVVLLDDQSVFVRRKRLICWLDTRNNNILGVLFKPILGLAASEGGCAFYILLPLSLFFLGISNTCSLHFWTAMFPLFFVMSKYPTSLLMFLPFYVFALRSHQNGGVCLYSYLYPSPI